MDRYKVFMNRFELSEDFQAKMTVEQLKTQLNQFGITPDQMFIYKLKFYYVLNNLKDPFYLLTMY